MQLDHRSCGSVAALWNYQSILSGIAALPRSIELTTVVCVVDGLCKYPRGGGKESQNVKAETHQNKLN